MATPLSSSFPLLFLARFSASVVALLVITWALHFKTSFIPQSPSQEQHIYAVRKNPFFFLHSWFLLNAMCMHVSEGDSWNSNFCDQVMHPLLMVIGFILITGEGRSFFFFFFLKSWSLFCNWESRGSLGIQSWQNSNSPNESLNLFVIGKLGQADFELGLSDSLLNLVVSAILVHKWLPGSRNMKKLVHLCLQGVALACGIFGIWTRFESQDGIVANFYSLHSWMGLICITLFGAQVCPRCF